MFSKLKFNIVYLIGLVSTAQSGAALANDSSASVYAPPLYQFSMMSSYRSLQGRFDPFGIYVQNPPGTSFSMMISFLDFSYHLSKQWEADLAVPVFHGQGIFPGGSANFSSVGSPMIQAKYSLIQSREWTLTTHAGVTLPFTVWSSRSGDALSDFSQNSTSSNLGAGAMMTSSVNLGLGASRAFGRFRVFADSGVYFPFSQSVYQADLPPGVSASLLQPGIRFQSMEGASYSIDPHWGVHAGFRQIWALDSTVDGSDVAGSASRLFSSSAGVNYCPKPSWRFGVDFDSPYPFYKYEVNQPYAPGIMVSVAYIGF